MLNYFKQGNAHLAIVAYNPQEMVEEANLMFEAIKKGTDTDIKTHSHEVIGILSLERVLEAILN